MIKLSDYIFQQIAKEGVRHVFMLPGGGCMHLVDSLGRCSELEYVCNLHEQACGIAADAYGQYTNNLGVALVTTGPGGTNAFTGLAAAWLESTPCLFLSGQVKRKDSATERGVRQMGFQELPIIDIVKPVTKYAVTVMEPDRIRYHLEKALYLARAGRPGPVWLDIPLDVQSASIEEKRLVGFDRSEFEIDFNEIALKHQVKETIELLNQAERPVLLVGNGVRLAKVIPEFLKLIEILQVPVLTTWKTIDLLSENHPLFIGRPGSIGQRGANFAQQNSDWILCIGARLDFGQTAYNHNLFARGAKKVIVDIDAAEINKLQTKIDVPVVADAGKFIRELLSQIKNVKKLDRAVWWKKCRDWKAIYPVVLKKYWDEQDRVNNYVLVDAITDAMTPNDVLIPGVSGQCSEITMQSFRVKTGQRILSSHGLGAMGFGIPASIAGCLASGKRRTICIDGDGGFHMNTQELETLRRLNLPVKFFVLNNDGYGSIRSMQRNYFNGRYVASSPDSGLTLPDTLDIAAAYGITTMRIENHDHIKEHVREVLETEGPVVCDVLINLDQLTQPRVVSRQLANGQMVSAPMEDLFPFLEKDEFEKNMIVPPLQRE